MANPTIPQYAQAAPLPNENCAGCGNQSLYYPPLVVPGGSSRELIIEEGVGIDVQDLSDSETDHFKISQTPISQLTAEMSVIAKSGDDEYENPILIGIEIDSLIPSWSYSGAVTSQELSLDLASGDEMDIPSLTSGERTKELEDGSITDDATITISGDNGQGFPQSEASASAQILFGNHVAWGDHANLIGSDVDDLQGVFDGFDKAIQRSRARSLTTTGGENEYFIYMVPVRFGEVTFQKGIFVGGYRELLNVDGLLVAENELGSGDDPEEITIENEAGYSEAFRVYQSLYDNKNDPDTPTIAS